MDDRRNSVDVASSTGSAAFTRVSWGTERRVAGKLRRELLDRHEPIKLDIPRQMHRAHATPAQQTADLIPTGETRMNIRHFGRRGHRPSVTGGATGRRAAYLWSEHDA